MLINPALASARILIVGDVMLDKYWFGEVNRISPEAPVPVVQIKTIEERPGGAANVARNIVALGAHATLISVIGNDEAGDKILTLLHDDKVDSVIHRDASIATTIKLRIIGRQQQLLRIDFDTPPSHEILTAALVDIERLLDNAQVVILSDYGKGGLTHIEKMIELANRKGKLVLVDPKGEDYSRYRNATLITPNRAEFKEVAGNWKTESELTEKAQRLRTSLNLKALLITRSEQGMSLYRENSVVHEPTRAREVYDVSGAGDTVIATLGVMLASGMDMGEAMHMANHAAGIVVGKLGAAVVSREELFKPRNGS